MALVGPIELLLSSCWHGRYNHGVVEEVPGKLEVCFGTHATYSLVLQVSPVDASQPLASAVGVPLDHGEVSDPVLDYGVGDIQTFLQGVDQGVELYGGPVQLVDKLVEPCSVHQQLGLGN